MTTSNATYTRARPRTIRHAVRTVLLRILVITTQSPPPKMSKNTCIRPYSQSGEVTPITTAIARALKTWCSMAGIIRASALPFGVTSEKG